jgi:hypothetical protein
MLNKKTRAASATITNSIIYLIFFSKSTFNIPNVAILGIFEQDYVHSCLSAAEPPSAITIFSIRRCAGIAGNITGHLKKGISVPDRGGGEI